MKHPEQTTKSPTAKTGLFATLAASLRGGGSGALSSGFGFGGRTASLRLVALTVIGAAAFLALGAAPALAAPPSEFGEPGTGAGNIAPQSRGIAIDQATGDVFINDGFNSRADRFGSEGAFKLSFGWGVADGAEELQTCGPLSSPLTATCLGGIIGFSPVGAGQFGLGPNGAAVDNSGVPGRQGDVYFNDSPARITKFSPLGEFLFMIGGGVDQGGGTPANPGNICTAAFLANGDTCGEAAAGSGPGEFEVLGHEPIAVDSAGTLYVGDNARIQKFSPAGAFEGQIALPGVVAEKVAVDSTADIYVMGSGLEGVHKYDPIGTELGEPRDTSAPSNATIAIGPSDQLLVDHPEAERLNAYGAAGKQLLSIPSGHFDGIAYGTTQERVYGLDSGTVHLLSLPPTGRPLLVPPGEEATGIDTTIATLKATVNPEGGEETSYRFQYVDQHSFETEGGFASPNTEETAPQELTGGAFEDQLASAAITGLQTRTTYHWRILVTNKAAETLEGPDQTFQTLPPVSVDSTSASGVSATAATLETELNPHGLPTTFHFEYGTVEYTEGGGPHGESTPTGSAGSGTADVTRTAPISGLAPNTTYHFRVIATNSLGTTEGPDRAFTTQPPSAATLLPDNRAWELVSPPNKHGVPLEAISEAGNVIQAAADGSGLTFSADGSINAQAPGNRATDVSQLLARRGPSGWTTADISTPHRAQAGIEVGSPSEYKLFSPDLSRAALEPKGATPLSLQASERTPYRREADGAYTPLVTEVNTPEGTEFGGIERQPEGLELGVHFITATPDLTHVLLESPKALTEEFVPGFDPPYSGQRNVYEWSAGALQLVSQIPSGSATACGGTGPACLPASEAGRNSGVGNGFQVRHAISADGSRVVFHTNFGPEGSPSLYLRDLSSGETLALDAAQGGSGKSGQGEFQDASADGSRVFFTDASRLTADSTAANSKPDLYMCQIEEDAEGHLACALTDLTANTVDPSEPANVQGSIIGASAESSSVYFVAQGALTAGEGAVPGDCGFEFGTHAPLGQCNLYRYDVATATTRLIAVLSGADFNDWAASGPQDLGDLTARVSPNGRWLAFMSERSLTGYDNRDAASGQRDQEVFLYDSQAAAGEGGLLCASCNPTGARPTGVQGPPNVPRQLVDGPGNWAGRWLAASIPGWTEVDLAHALYQSRYLTDSGRLFFNAADALVPSDSNGTEDVYQFEPPGVGDCSESNPTFAPVNGGCVSLISSGTSREESAFLDASESGDDVFFLTASRLTPKDEDKALDVYDARVGGGEPSVVKPVECAGDACQQPAVPPNDPTPGSLTFNGAGNLLQCPKGKVKKHGKCVAKHHKKKHPKKNHKAKKSQTKRSANNHRRASR